MTLDECYEKLNGNLATVRSNLPSDKFINRMLKMFLDKNPVVKLREGVQEEDWKKAFNGAHDLKSNSGNLGFTELFASASILADQLRPNADPKPGDEPVPVDPVLLADTEAKCDLVVSVLEEYLK